MFEKNVKMLKACDDEVIKEYIKEMEEYLDNDDGTPGLGDFLWEKYAEPLYKKALERYAMIRQEANSVMMKLADN